MSILSDFSIKKAQDLGNSQLYPVEHNDDYLFVYPRLADNQRQPASIDVTLSNTFLVYKHQWKKHFWFLTRFPKLRKYVCLTPDMKTIYCRGDKPFILRPGHFALASIQQTVHIPSYLMGFIEGTSTHGRRATFVHITASMLHPGYKGKPTLEILNMSPFCIMLYPGETIAQIRFETLTTTCDRPYGHPDLKSRYQGDTAVTESQR